MPKATLNLEALAVESFATTVVPPQAAAGAVKASGATSCPRPGPVCTC